jgi:hypothetical protein
MNLEAILILTLGGTGGLLTKWIWDRYLSQSSRVTEALCDKKREACVLKIMSAVEKHTERLRGGDQCFADMEGELRQIRGLLNALKYSILILCQEMKIDCDKITKIMMENEVE